MSRLINPGLGDLIDRLTILALKRLHGAAAGKDTAHFDREWAAIHSMVSARNGSGKWLEAALELGAVNAHLWALTDVIQQWEKQETTWRTVDSSGLGGPGSEPHKNILVEAGAVGLSILRLNNRRAALVQAINTAAGDPTGLEKLT